MRYVKWAFRIVLALFVFAFLHYNLPQRDIVRIVGAESRRIDYGENSIFWASPEVGMAEGGANRDVFFIQAVYPSGGTMEYRNEDTGWGWPPYFKINTFGLQTQATDLISTADNPKWVIVTHYGWRNKFFTIFPNAVGVRQTESPDVRLIPWLNIVILSAVAGLIFLLWRIWRQFRERTIDPALGRAAEAWDKVDDRADAARASALGAWGRFRAWLDTWKAKPRR
jgi:hypothetical protein